MRILMTMILWTWGLTPTWVNIVGTVIMGLGCLNSLAEVGKKK
jgi:hypothetical protein